MLTNSLTVNSLPAATDSIRLNDLPALLGPYAITALSSSEDVSRYLDPALKGRATRRKPLWG